eukprot:GFKZ01013739.1.p2 GENE.GFKZ01013739.1~~GFKZ01013739.1.p2  ORF type:complete len:137 (-),score=17.73 GFKZ01013739.1:444-854(-)
MTHPLLHPTTLHPHSPTSSHMKSPHPPTPITPVPQPSNPTTSSKPHPKPHSTPPPSHPHSLLSTLTSPSTKQHTTHATTPQHTVASTPDLWDALSWIDEEDEPMHQDVYVPPNDAGVVAWHRMDLLMNTFEYRGPK